jgi:hypothetical protein
MSQKKAQLFQNTQEAVRYGENASLDDMSKLVNQLVNSIIGKMVDITCEVQFYNEAYHAFTKDDWYQEYCKKS